MTYLLFLRDLNELNDRMDIRYEQNDLSVSLWNYMIQFLSIDQIKYVFCAYHLEFKLPRYTTGG
jgi:hypothetical protein